MPLAEHGGPTPITGSHEPAGTVVGFGEGVEGWGKFKKGDRVMAVNTARGCSEIFIPDLARTIESRG